MARIGTFVEPKRTTSTGDDLVAKVKECLSYDGSKANGASSNEAGKPVVFKFRS